MQKIKNNLIKDKLEIVLRKIQNNSNRNYWNENDRKDRNIIERLGEFDILKDKNINMALNLLDDFINDKKIKEGKVLNPISELTKRINNQLPPLIVNIDTNNNNDNSNNNSNTNEKKQMRKIVII